MIRTGIFLLLAAALDPARAADLWLVELKSKLAQRQSLAPGAGARLGGALAESRARLSAAAAGGDAGVRAEREKLASLDREFEAEFQRVEATLRGAGLSPVALGEKLAAWRGFTAHYRARMDAALDALARGDARGALGLLADSAAGAPARAVGANGGATRRRPPMADPEALAAPPAAGDLPAPADLASNDSVLLTADIQSTAAAYGKSPAALYALVHDFVELVPYRLGMMNSEAVLWSHRGNDLDQSTLLIALLRAAGIPARYVIGTMQVPYNGVVNWMGAKDLTNALSLLDDLTRYTDLGGKVSLRHTWVEAWIDSGAGPQWVAMAPGFKTRTIQPGMALAKPTFDRMKFFGSVTSQLASEAYLDQLLAVVRQTQAGAGLGDLPYLGTIVPASPADLPTLPYPAESVIARYSTMPSADQHSATITLSNAANAKTVYFTTELYLPRISIDSLTISFAPATPNDAAVIAAFGGLEGTPAAVANLTPQLRLNDAVILTSKTSVAAGTALNLEVAVFLPSATDASIVDDHDVAAGQSVAIGLSGGQVRNVLVSSRIDRLLNLIATSAADDAVTREFLNVALLRYFQRFNTQKESIANAAQLRFSSRRVEEAATIAGSTVQKLFDRPFYLVPGPLLLDAKGMLTAFIDLNAPDTSSAVDQSLRDMIESASSGLEGQLWEELVLAPSICTVKALQLASQAGQPLVTLTSANAARQLAGSKIPLATQKQMIADAGNGANIVTTLQPVTYNAWTGVAWTRDFPDGKWAYLIQNLNGGSTTGPTPPAPPTSQPGSTGNPATTNGTTQGDPVSVSNGNLFQQEIDFSISSRGPSLVLGRTYNSLLAGNDSPFGFGWSHSYNLSLRDKGTSVTFVNESGGSYTFTSQGASYGAPAGLNLSLTKDASGFTLRSPQGAQWRFSLAGKLESIADRNGNTVQLSYDSANRLMRVADSLGRPLNFFYDEANHIANVQDFAGRQTLYGYDAAGRLVAFTDTAGHKTTYGYAAGPVFPNGLTSLTTAAGKTTAWEYYENGEVATVIEAGGRKMHFFYLPMRNQTVYVDDRSYTTYYFYNALGNVTRMVLPDGNIRDLTYSADAKLLTATDEGGGATSYSWDANGNNTRVADAVGNVTVFTYEPKFNSVASVTDSLGAVTRFEYDERGNLTHATYPLGGEIRYTYDSSGQILAFTDAEGNTWTYAYDAAGNRVAVTDPLGNTAATEYDALRRPTTTSDALHNTARFRYDALNRTTATWDGEGNSTTFAYDAQGNLASVTDPAGRTARYAYDALDQLSTVTDSLGQPTQYDSSPPSCLCTAAPNITTYRDASGGGALSFNYDSRNHLSQAADAAGRTVTFLYDARGRLARKTDANGNAISFEYDAAGRVTRKSYSDGSEARFTYDGNNNLLTAANANSTLTFRYDTLNRMISAADSRFDGALLQSWDRTGHRTALTDPSGGGFTYTYDKAGGLGSIVNPAGAAVQITRDAAGRTTALSLSNGTTASWSYDHASRKTALLWSSAAGAALPQFALTYDAVGNPTSMTDAAGTHQYQYDALNRLTSATHPALAAESYGYDPAGNRTASATDSKYAYDVSGRLASAEGAAYTWDKNGNLSGRQDSRGATTYTYDLENRLVGIVFPGGGTAAYKYDALGHRIEKSVNGVVARYLYDGADVLLEFDGGNQFQARYTHGPGVDQPVIMERGGAVYFFHADPSGSIRSLSDASGQPVRASSYDSFGRMALFGAGFDAAAQPATPYAFAGREYDAESGFYYLRARYYDPATGRFVNADPLDVPALLVTGRASVLRDPQQLNLYSYAANNPLAFRDPTGLKPATIYMSGEASGGVMSLNMGGPFSTESHQMNNLGHWMSVNGYQLDFGSYDGCGAINIVDPTKMDWMGNYHVVAAAFVSNLPQEYQQTAAQQANNAPRPGDPGYATYVWNQLSATPWHDYFQGMGEQIQKEYNKPWYTLSGSDWWSEVMNPGSVLPNSPTGK
jgi:RHS repeat-associated protein